MNFSAPLNWHESFIVDLVKWLRPKLYVELGLSTCTLFNQVVPFADRLIGVDISPEAGRYMQFSPKVCFVNATTRDYANQFKMSPLSIDLLFIDADHAKEAVLEDFNAFFPWVTPDGLILLHDTYPTLELLKPEYCGTAYQAVWELTSNNQDYELVTLPIPPGLTICRKRRRQLSWQTSL